MIIICEICKQQIAKADRSTLKAPMDGSMFGSLKPQWPAPFLPGQVWMWVECPYCENRPFHRQDAVMTPAGLYVLPGEQVASAAAERQAIIDAEFPEEPEEKPKPKKRKPAKPRKKAAK